MEKVSKEQAFLDAPIFSALVKFAIPVLGAMFLQAAYGAVDLMMVGQFGGADSISAVGSGSTLMHMVTFMITGLATGATVAIGQHIGEKRPKAAGNAVGTTIILFIILGIVMTVLMEIFAGGIVGILQVPREASAKAIQYIRICSAGIVVIIAYNVISGILRGIGNARLPLIFVIVAFAANVIGDYVLVGIFRMDAAGAAIATIGAQLISVIVSLIALKRVDIPVEFSLDQCRIYREELSFILKVGIPIALQEVIVQISFLMINTVINKMGLDESAGYSVAMKLTGFIMLWTSSLMQSVSAFVAQNVGAGQFKRARKGYFTAMVGGLCVGVVLFLVAFFGADVLAGIFARDPAVVHQSALYLKGFCVDCILTCVVFTSIGYFNGRGVTLPVMLQGITASFLCRMPLSLILSKLPNTSLFIVGFAAPLSSVYGIIFFLVCLMVMNNRDKKQGIIYK